MATMRVAMEGLDQLRAQLKALPADLSKEARLRVLIQASAAAQDLREAYPEGGTGNLRRGVKVTVDESSASTTATVRSSSAHAHLWEFGTQNRRTQQGWNRGSGPAHYNQGLVGIASRRRRALNSDLVDIVRKAGFEVGESV